jgi:hypothetical protein
MRQRIIIPQAFVEAYKAFKRTGCRRGDVKVFVIRQARAFDVHRATIFRWMACGQNQNATKCD